MNAIVPFEFDSMQVRVVVFDDSSSLFVARDVATALGYVDTTQAIRGNCKRAKSLKDIGASGGRPQQNQQLSELDPQTKLIPESDVYRLVMRSKLPSAERFQDWVVEEVLPSIRQTGNYGKPDEVIAGLADLVSNLANIAGQLVALKIATIAPVPTPDLPVTHIPLDGPLLTAADLARLIGVSMREMNKRLTQAGFQTVTKNGHGAITYHLTDKGKTYGTLVDTLRRTRDGKSIHVIRWTKKTYGYFKQPELTFH